MYFPLIFTIEHHESDHLKQVFPLNRGKIFSFVSTRNRNGEEIYFSLLFSILSPSLSLSLSSVAREERYRRTAEFSDRLVSDRENVVPQRKLTSGTKRKRKLESIDQRGCSSRAAPFHRNYRVNESLQIFNAIAY